MNLKDYVPDKNFRALLVGPTGRGKTVAAASFPGRTKIFDFDNRHKPIVQWPAFKERVANGDFDVDVITPTNFWDTFHPAVNRLADGPKPPFENILVDGITGMSTTTIVMQMKVKGQEGKITKGGIAVPSWDEFNGEAMLLTQLLETLKSIPCNLFVTAHPIEKTKIEGGSSIKSSSLIAFGTKVGPMIPGYFDEVYYFDYKFSVNANKPVGRLVRTRPSTDYPDAKTSLDKMPDVLDITNRNFYDVIKEYL